MANRREVANWAKTETYSGMNASECNAGTGSLSWDKKWHSVAQPKTIKADSSCRNCLHWRYANGCRRGLEKPTERDYDRNECKEFYPNWLERRRVDSYNGTKTDLQKLFESWTRRCDSCPNVCIGYFETSPCKINELDRVGCMEYKEER